MKFFYVYYLKSQNHDFYYTGFTGDLRKRFEEHNNQKVKSTKSYASFNLIFFEGFTSIKDAVRREKYFKTTKGRSSLKQIIRNSICKNG